MDNQNSQHMNSNKISELRGLKNVKQQHVSLPTINTASTLHPKQVDQNVNVHASNKDRNNDSLVAASNKRKLISPAKLPKTIAQKQGNQKVTVHSSRKDKNNDCLVGASNKRKLTASTKPPKTLAQKQGNQNVTVHSSHKDNSDRLVGASNKRKVISSDKLPTTIDQKHGNQNVAVHPSHKDHKNDCLVVTSNKRELIPSDINKKLSKISNKESVYCYTCESIVTEKGIFQHLFFGQMECANCSARIMSCKNFYNMYHSQDICRNNGEGPHIYEKWTKDPVLYLQYYIRKDLAIKRFCKNLTGYISLSETRCATAHYLRKIQVLKAHNPWKLAFDKSRFSSHIEKILTENDIRQAESGSNHTASNNKFREQDSKHFGQHSISASNSLTHKQENVLVNSGDTPLGVTNDTKEVSFSKKGVKLGHCNETRGHINKVNSTPRNSNLIRRVDQYSKSVSKSLTHGKENGLIASVNENPHTVSSNLKKIKKPNKQMKNNQRTGSNISRQAKSADDQCLVVHRSKGKCPEKCPKCQCTLSISTLTFDCSTFVMKIVCPDCAFPVYIMPDWKTKLMFQKRLSASNV